MSAKKSFSCDVVNGVKSRIADAIENVSYDNRRTFLRFFMLTQLRDELVDFQADMNLLRQGRGQFKLALDRNCLRAFAEMDDEAKNLFSFPVSISGEDEGDRLRNRGNEYLFRLESILGSDRTYPFMLPPDVDGMREHISNFSNLVSAAQRFIEVNHGLLKKQTIEGYGALKRNRPMYVDWLRTIGTSDNADGIFLQTKSGDAKLGVWTEAEARTSVSMIALSSLIRRGNVAVSRYRNVFDDSSLSFLSEIQPGDLGISSDEHRAEFEAIADGDGIEGYRPITEGLFDALYAIDRVFHNISHKGERVQPENWMWRAAESLTYVHALNDILRRAGSGSMVQFITHRRLLSRVVRAFPASELLVPTRHPKFLAAALAPETIVDVYDNVERINSVLDSYIRSRLDERAVLEGDLKNQLSCLGDPWTALKGKIYSAEAGYLAPKTDFDQAMSEVPRGIIDQVAEHSRGDSAPALVLTRILKEQTDKLLQKMYLPIVKGTGLRAYFVPARPLEDAHWLVFPKVKRLRYALKLNKGFFGPEFSDGEWREFSLSDLIEKVSNSSPDEVRKGVLGVGLAALIAGNWSIAEDYLEDGRLKAGDEALELERLYLLHLAKRGCAAQKRRNLNVARELIMEALDIAVRLVSQRPSDFRFRLALSAARLEAICRNDYGSNEEFRNAVMGICESSSACFLSIVKDCMSVAAEIDERARDEAAPAQARYWNYMKGRAFQLVLTAYMAAWARRTPSYMNDIHNLLYEKQYKIDWDSLFQQFSSCLTDPQEEGGTDAFDGVHPEFPKRVKNPAATFVWHFAKLHFCYGMGRSIVRDDGETPMARLQAVTTDISSIYACLAALESSCTKLSFNGFSRQLFREVKRTAYPLVHDNLKRTTDSLFRDLQEGLDRSSQ